MTGMLGIRLCNSKLVSCLQLTPIVQVQAACIVYQLLVFHACCSQSMATNHQIRHQSILALSFTIYNKSRLCQLFFGVIGYMCVKKPFECSDCFLNVQQGCSFLPHSRGFRPQLDQKCGYESKPLRNFFFLFRSRFHLALASQSFSFFHFFYITINIFYFR